MCLYPKLIYNRKYTRTAKNQGNVPTLKDKRVAWVPIGCQNCMECRKQKAREWQVRLLEDIKTNTNGKFITFTFSNEKIKEILQLEPTKNWPGFKGLTGYQLDNEIATRATRLFLERYRKENKKSLRHWLVTELGGSGTENIHMHGIIWTDKPLEEIEKIWQYGWVWKYKWENGKKINYVNERTVNYITKYVNKTDEQHSQYKSKILTSPGIGNNYTNTYNSKRNTYNTTKTIETYRTRTGHRIAIPIYWRNKIYTDEQKEKLWLQKLDKQTRWVTGIKINVSTPKGEQNYYNILKHKQELNTELGYGKGTDWVKLKYENEIRNIKIKQRILNASPAGQLNMNTD